MLSLWFLFYIIIILVLVTITYLNFRRYYKKHIVYLVTPLFKISYKIFIIFIILFFIHFTRDVNLGSDYSNYVDMYQYTVNTGELPWQLKYKESGYTYLQKIFANTGVSYKVFFASLSIIIWYFFLKASYKFVFLLPIMLYFSIVDGFFLWSQSGIRQAIAITIFFYSVRFIIEKRILLYIFFIYIASLFHISAILLLPFYFTNKIKFNRKVVFYLFIFTASGLASLLLIPLIQYLLKLIFSSNHIFYTYVQYIDILTYANESNKGSGLGYIIRFLSTLYIIHQSNNVLKNQPNLSVYYNLFFIGLFIGNMFLYNEIVLRFILYFKILFTIVIASTIYYSRKRYEKMISIVLISLYFLIFLSQVYQLNINYYNY